MKKKLIIIGIILVAFGGAVCWFFNRKAPLFDAAEGVCPRCLSHDVRRWEYGLGAMDTDEVILEEDVLCLLILPNIIVMSVASIGVM